VNDYTLSRADSSVSLHSYDGDFYQSRSLSPVVGRSIGSTGERVRSPILSQSHDFERRQRSQSPQRYLHNDYSNGYTVDGGEIFYLSFDK
jgi:hypothetical protein